MLRRSQKQEFAVIGLGRFGSSLARSLEEHGHTVLGIDADEEIVQRIADQITQAVRMDATNEEALKEVDIASFDTVVVAIGNDFEDNLITTVALKGLGVRRVISKAQTSRQREILLRVGADRVIQPEKEAGRRLADELSLPAMMEKLPLGPEHSLVELVVPKSLVWKSLAQSDVRNRYGITVLLIKRADELLVLPRADTVLQDGDILVIVGTNERVIQFSSLP